MPPEPSRPPAVSITASRERPCGPCGPSSRGCRRQSPPPYPGFGCTAGFDRQGELVGLAIETRGLGYQDSIGLIYGYSFDKQAIIGIRVLESRETPGLGDRIESSKSDWVRQFDGRSLQDPQGDDWKIRRDGGQFDQLTGASVTPRAVVKAIRETLQYFDANAVAIFSAAADKEDEVSE